ncbi:MAG: efflux RND transporter periplasmic adaptor subunit [Bacillota bacterium]
MKKKLIVVAIILVVFAGLIGLNVLISKSTRTVFNQGTTYSVKTVAIEKGSISSSISASGNIEEVKQYEVYVDTPLKVNKLLVEKYEKVTKGQKLMELDLEGLESELEKLKINRKVQELSKNSPAVEAEIKRAESAVKSAERALNDSVEKYNNSKTLYDAQAISKSELDMAEKAVNEARTALDNAKITHRSALENKDVDRKIKEENLGATILGISDLEKKIEKLKDSMLSPIDGILVEVNVQEGSFTSNVQPVFRIINTDKLQVKASVSEFNMKDVKAGQKVKITGEAIDEEAEVMGIVDSISPVAKLNRTAGGEEVVVEVIISIDNTDARLKPGLSVDCEILTNEKENITVVPQNTTKEDKDGKLFVYLVDKEKNIMVQRYVKLGIVSDMMAEVLEGLSTGDVVVLDPQPFYKDGARIRITENK